MVNKSWHSRMAASTSWLDKPERTWRRSSADALAPRDGRERFQMEWAGQHRHM